MAFPLKEGPRASDFITEDNLRTSELALSEDPQVILAIGSFIATLSPTTGAPIETMVGSISGFNVVLFATLLSSLLITLPFRLSFLCVN